MVKIGIIGGSGLEDPQILSNIHEEEVATPYGKPTSALKHGIINGKEVILISPWQTSPVFSHRSELQG